jgi:hypothetical protein
MFVRERRYKWCRRVYPQPQHASHGSRLIRMAWS